MTMVKLDQPLTDVLYSFGSTRTRFRSYQFKPLLKLLNSSTQRLLIADEVGLGKTIEAGLIWAELDRRVGIRRGLVVCPASLTRKWQSEMKRRFDRDVEIIDRRRLRELTLAFEEGRDPKFTGIVSIESLRTSPDLDALAEHSPKFDLIVVDEAHALRNTGTRSFALGELLSDWADVLLFLSATPLNLGRDDLFNLLNLLSPDDFPDRFVFDGQLAPNEAVNRALALLRDPQTDRDMVLNALSDVGNSAVGALITRRPEFTRTKEIVESGVLDSQARSEATRLLLGLNTLSTIVTRTRKVDTPDAKATRVARTINVSWTPNEQRLYLAILEWARERALANHGNVGFATIMPLRQAASCLQASKELLLAKHSELSGFDDDLDDLDGIETDDFVDDNLDLSAAGQELSAALRALGDRVDTKFDEFVSMLEALDREGIGQVMVFSFFRGTLRYLHHRLSPTRRVRVMDGSIASMDERARIMTDFREGKFDVLLLSEVGSEGLDFEFCGALVNYDLPWNPMRVEQRIGRLDRFGQKFEKIHILNFHVPGTIETDIFSRLYARIRVFEQSIGELEPIIRDDMSEITRIVLDPHRTEAERTLEVDRIAVALEHRHAELEQLKAASSKMLTGLDQVLIDGLERDTRSSGKFVGEAEIESVLQLFLKSFGGTLKPPKGTSRFHQIIGTPELVQRAQRLLADAQAPSLERWASDLRDGMPILCTFAADLAMESAAEFLTLSHPLVQAARLYHSLHYAFPNRLGVAAVEGVDPTRTYLTLLGVVEVNGIQPAIELRHPTIDLGSRTRADEVGLSLVAAHARGELREPPGHPPADTHDCVELLEVAMDEIRDQLELDRRTTNAALIDGRKLTLERTFASKIDRAQSTLRKLQFDGRSESIQRLHKGRIANLTTEREVALERLEEQRTFSVIWKPVGLVLVSGL